ncbi:hypothetical protein F0U62_19840 [Cystobacter fuscus]|uniref:hypothetical protein n=1 Tax=Cystobacter fuscus TaxID=43 RepID=UPI002B2B306D|nr:hypothetical protein F0U62_19840 [Cystobacter fuscus]
MMKTLKMGFFGLALGALGAVAFPTHEAAAQSAGTPATPAQQVNCCSNCNPQFQRCFTSATDAVKLTTCHLQRSICEQSCARTC